ncbi:MAG: ABC transporter ATP-binding protein [Paracoccaceae bacterium]
MTLLSTRGLNVSIGRKSVLKNVSFDIAPGEIVAVTGESGSGKSMTALSIIDLLPEGAQTVGEILLNGTDLRKQTEAQMCETRGQAIGMVFQEPMTALNPVKTIGDQVSESIYLHRPGVDAESVTARTLSRVGLPPDRFPLTRYPHELSGGQRQRVVIAMAIACGPRLLIADEPTTALDVTTQAQILDLLKRLTHEDGMGLLMITHDLAVVADMADRILVMRDGEIVEQGETQNLLRNMQHPYTKMLFHASTHQAELPQTDPEAEVETPLLSVNQARRDYRLPRTRLFARAKHFRAVDDVSFDIKRGERVGLVGESGCGKSTLTRAILGLEKVQGGQIRLDGAPVFAGRRPNLAVRRKMQVVFQDPYGSFNPRHRVERLICEPFHLLSDAPTGRKRDDLIAETLEAVGLSADDARKYPHQFSGGQRQRIAIARALIIRPELVIFDEAVSALDVSVRARILDLIADLCRAYNLTYLFISHDLNVVRSITDRVMVMAGGKIIETGPTAQVFDNPYHLYTKSLVAASPMLPALDR